MFKLWCEWGISPSFDQKKLKILDFKSPNVKRSPQNYKVSNRKLIQKKFTPALALKCYPRDLIDQESGQQLHFQRAHFPFCPQNGGYCREQFVIRRAY